MVSAHGDVTDIRTFRTAGESAAARGSGYGALREGLAYNHGNIRAFEFLVSPRKEQLSMNAVNPIGQVIHTVPDVDGLSDHTSCCEGVWYAD